MKREILQGFALSPQQKRLWLLSQPDQGRIYRAEAVLLIEGDLRADALGRALRRVVRNYEILRTCFRRLPEMELPLQVMEQNLPRLTKSFDFSQWTNEEQEARAQALIDDLGGRGFDLERGPIIAVALVKLSLNSHILMIAMPSLCADEITLGNLMRELALSYSNYEEDGVPNDEPAQYGVVSAWLNEFLESADAEIGREYWRKQDTADLFSARLPFEVHLADERDFRPRSLRLAVDPQVGARVGEISACHNASATAVLLACWQILLWRLMGQSEIKIGFACDGRTDQALTGAIGLLARYLFLQTRLQPEMRFDELLVVVESRMREVSFWQECFTWEEIAKTSDQSDAHSFFSFCFDFVEDPAPVEAEGIKFSLCSRRSIFDRFKIRLACRWGQSPVLELIYDSSLFREADMRHLLRQFHTLLGSAARGPRMRIGDLEIADEIDRQRVLIEFNDTRSDLPERASFSHFIEDHAANMGDKVALTFEGERLTYYQLNARSNQLAHYLMRLGIRPEEKIAVLIDRSPDLVIGLLGIVKAGGAYVPLEPGYPGQRLSHILREAQINIILTWERHASKLRDYSKNIVCLDSMREEIGKESQENIVGGEIGEELAYVIYTSGSTGLPKGVMVTHRGLLNYLAWCVEAYEVKQGKGAPVHSPIGFDLTVTALLAPLVAGCGVELIAEEKGLGALIDALRHNGPYGLVKITPAHLELVNQMLPAEAASKSAKLLVIGGESLSRERVSFWRTHAPETILVNEYGPTETVVGCCVYEIPGESDLPPTIPIGRPVANARLYLVDRRLNAAPVGAIGELLVGGEGVARGYLLRPVITADRFIPDPFSESPGKRTYRTGDLARFRSDDQLEFLGRIDDQVKLRGLRIELGEIAAVLKLHPAVREAVVSLSKGQSGVEFLVAYLVVYEEMPVIDKLRDFLQQRLLDYMIPSHFIRLERLPLTANGKIDRRALPAPDESRRSFEIDYVAPSSPVEEILAEIWVELLGIERAGIYDNFFKIGGNSLLATQLVSRLQRVFRVELPLRSFFQSPTIKGLADTLGACESSPGQVEAVARLRKKIEGMSAEEIRMLIQGKKEASGATL